PAPRRGRGQRPRAAEPGRLPLRARGQGRVPRGGVPQHHRRGRPRRLHPPRPARGEGRGARMTSATIAPRAAEARPRRNLLKLVITETRFEFLKLLRLPVYSVATLAFPLMFFLLFSTIFGGGEAQGVGTARYLLATYGAAGVVSAALFSFGVGVASERGQGWMRLKRVSPMPPAAYFAAKIGMALLFAAMVVVTLTLAAMLIQGVRFAALDWLRMLGMLLVGVFPFATLGLAIGYLFGPNSAPVVINQIGRAHV